MVLTDKQFDKVITLSWLIKDIMYDLDRDECEKCMGLGIVAHNFYKKCAKHAVLDVVHNYVIWLAHLHEDIEKVFLNDETVYHNNEEDPYMPSQSLYIIWREEGCFLVASDRYSCYVGLGEPEYETVKTLYEGLDPDETVDIRIRAGINFLFPTWLTDEQEEVLPDFCFV